MNNFIKSLIVPCVVLLAAPAAAQTATGTGVGIANSNSQSGAVAIAGTGGRGGNSSLTLNSSVPSTTTSNVNESGTTTIRNVPTAIAPGLTAAGLETCLGSVSGGASVVGFGGSFGTTIPDPGCAARLDARTLWSMGLKKAAVARLCLTPEIYRSMPEVCGAYLPAAPGSAVAAVAAVAPAVEVPPYFGGPIELIDGKTGQMRSCDDYDQARQRCRLWTGQHHRRKIAATVSPKKPVATVAAAKPAADPAAESKKEN